MGTIWGLSRQQGKNSVSLRLFSDAVRHHPRLSVLSCSIFGLSLAASGLLVQASNGMASSAANISSNTFNSLAARTTSQIPASSTLANVSPGSNEQGNASGTGPNTPDANIQITHTNDGTKSVTTVTVDGQTVSTTSTDGNDSAHKTVQTDDGQTAVNITSHNTNLGTSQNSIANSSLHVSSASHSGDDYSHSSTSISTHSSNSTFMYKQ